MPKAVVVFDIDGVVRDVGGSYRRALMDTVEHYTQGAYRPSSQDIDQIKAEGVWNNDWKLSQEMVERYFEAQGQGGQRELGLKYDAIVEFFQNRYRGPVSAPFTGYIQDEPLLMGRQYLQNLSDADLAWGFLAARRGFQPASFWSSAWASCSRCWWPWMKRRRSQLPTDCFRSAKRWPRAQRGCRWSMPEIPSPICT